MSAAPPGGTADALYLSAEEALRAGDHEVAAARFEEAGAAYLAKIDLRGIGRCADHLERYRRYAAAWSLMAEIGARRNPTGLPDWQGPPEPGPLLVSRRMRHLGAELRMARFAASAAGDCGEVVLAAEDRLVPLFRRSFPEVRVVAGDTAIARSGARCGASYEQLARFYGATPAALRGGFRALLPDPVRTARLRARYAAGRPAVGIAWYSENTRKDLPPLADWSDFLKRIDARLVSLQYRPEEAGIAELRRLSGREILVDPEIDQMVDLDGFAAQVAATDAVVSISNSTVHMAGALGRDAVVVLDDQPLLVWPIGSDAFDLAPCLRLIRRRRRDWSEVFAEALETLAPLLRA